ncbi:MAG: lamin tail domain-containing protein [Patescibacteria group bacterium]
MSKILQKSFLISVGLVLLFWYGVAEAGIVINETQLYPTDGRFIELYNPDDAEVDLTGWYMQRKTESGQSFTSLVSNPNFENKKIGGKKYFLIYRNQVQGADLVVDNLTLTESNTIQIKNPNGDVVDIVCWGSVSDCGKYKTTNPLEGQSAQRNQDGMFVGVPTPGLPNEKVNDPAPVPDPDPTPKPAPAPASEGGIVKSEKIEIKKLETNILTKSVVFAGIPAEFKAETVGVSNEKLLYGKYFWNFGDGDSRQTKTSDMTKFTHTFAYEGEYSVSLEYYESYYSETPNATDKIIVKVIKPNILISSVGDEKDFFIEITNDTLYEADLSGWMLIVEQKSFIFPKNTFLQLKKKITLSPKITGFNIVDKNSLKLLSLYSTLVFDYGASIKQTTIIEPEPMQIIAQTKSINTNATKTPAVENVVTSPDSKPESDIKIENSFEAQAISTEASVSRFSFDIKYIVALFAFLLFSSGAVYFVRVRYRKPVLEKAGSDFEILE